MRGRLFFFFCLSSVEEDNIKINYSVINSRTATAGAIIGLLLVFLQFQELELYWGAVLFKI